MALALGVADERAELLADTVSGRCRNNEPVCLHCEIRCAAEETVLVISPAVIQPSTGGEWQANARIPGLPDAALLEQLFRAILSAGLSRLIKSPAGWRISPAMACNWTVINRC